MVILKRPLKASTVNFSWTCPAGKFEPKLAPKYLQDISGSEDKVFSLYAEGMITGDIHDQLQDLYVIGMSADMVSKITGRILPEIKEGQSHPLNPVYPIIFMDCIHYKAREDGRILSHAAYIILGVTLDGYKDFLNIIVGANEAPTLWLGMLNDGTGARFIPSWRFSLKIVYPDFKLTWQKTGCLSSPA